MMRTTIVVEHGPAAAVAQGEAPASTDAGAAPAPSAAPPAAAAGDLDAGPPPSWLVDAIAEAGGVRAPSSLEGLDLGDQDAGSAPV